MFFFLYIKKTQRHKDILYILKDMASNPMEAQVVLTWLTWFPQVFLLTLYRQEDKVSKLPAAVLGGKYDERILVSFQKRKTKVHRFKLKINCFKFN